MTMSDQQISDVGGSAVPSGTVTAVRVAAGETAPPADLSPAAHAIFLEAKPREKCITIADKLDHLCAQYPGAYYERRIPAPGQVQLLFTMPDGDRVGAVGATTGEAFQLLAAKMREEF